MYRVMVVDDEEPVLDSFEFLLDKYSGSFKLCAKARTGFEAEKLIRELSPDLVFMDIQMPGIDGMETIKRVKDHHPNTVFILATAYERFDIAQKAIKLGVFSYLVKPVTKAKFLEELAKAEAYLDDRKKADSIKLSGNQNFIRELTWKNPAESEWAAFSAENDFDCTRAAVIIIGGDSIPGGPARAEAYGRITEKLQFKYLSLSAAAGDKLIILVPELQPLQKLQPHLRKLIDEQHPNFKLGWGGVRHFSELKDACAEAWGPFGDGGGLRTNKTGTSIENVLRAMLAAEQDEALNIFEEFRLHIFRQFDFNVAKAKMAVLFTLLFRETDRYLLLANNFDFDPSEQIMPLTSIEEWEQWAAPAGELICRLISDKKNLNYPRPLRTALDFISANYDSPLQLSQVAAECSISASYLSRLFSEHLDSRFIDYLNRYRISKALINMKNNKSIKEAAYLAGYSDPNYFSRVFRKFMGVTPSEYEKRSSN